MFNRRYDIEVLLPFFSFFFFNHNFLLTTLTLHLNCIYPGMFCLYCFPFSALYSNMNKFYSSTCIMLTNVCGFQCFVRLVNSVVTTMVYSRYTQSSMSGHMVCVWLGFVVKSHQLVLQLLHNIPCLQCLIGQSVKFT